MSLYKLNELSNELELKEKIKDIRKKTGILRKQSMTKVILIRGIVITK